MLPELSMIEGGILGATVLLALRWDSGESWRDLAKAAEEGVVCP